MAMQLPSSSSNSSFSDGFKFDVFISFRGPDTRYGFTGNLYKALSDKGIHTFIDDKELQRGDEITPSLLKSIEDSRIAIIVFSKNYASSSFCLDELAHIIYYFKEKGRLVLPVFYGVEPTDVRHQSGSYAEHLTKHEEKSMDRLRKWKEALSQAANLSGYHIKLGKEYEHNFIETIVKDVSKKINPISLHVADYPVGLEPRMLEVRLLLDMGSSDGVCIIGIHGTGGIGKTTLARAVYNSIVEQFEGSCFLHNVRENSVKHGLENLQEQLLSKTINLNIKIDNVSEGIPLITQRLSQKKILLILDDVDKLEQLQYLIGEPTWLGPGSKVLVTTRDKHLFESLGIERTYEVCGLNREEALEFFRRKVGKNKTIDSNYEYILNRSVTYASGLPLAIEVVGSNFSEMHMSKWDSTLDKYKRVPNKDIQNILKVSFDALDEEDKNVFLDIACCLKGYGLLEIEKILHAHYDYCIKDNLGVLVDKSLIKIDDDDVTLHDLLEDMGKEIVRQESPNKPGEHSRLWFHDDIVKVLREDMGTANIEMIYLNCPSMKNVIEWNGKAFKKMTNLKTLIIENGNFSRGPEYLPSSLRFLEWKGCPSRSLSSCISNKEFKDMKVFTLADCEYLTHIPDVSDLPNLEKLSFQNCHSLITIHNSVGYLNKLEILDVEGCNKLESFPPLRLPSLKELKLTRCESLKSFPELLCNMTYIKVISLCRTSIGELPFSFQYLSRGLHIYEGGMFRFSNLEFLDLASCKLSNECLQVVLKWCGNVKWLDLSGNNFKILPECLSECQHLKNFYLDDCKSLKEIRGFPQNLEVFSAMRCYSLSSSSIKMLLSQKLHESGYKEFCLLTGTEGIPDWFEHQKSKGDNTISFLFRKKIPSITVIILLESSDPIYDVNFYVNGYRRNPKKVDFDVLLPEHAVLFDLKLEEHIHNMFKSEISDTLLGNEWIPVKLRLDTDDFEEYKRFRNIHMGIHVLKEKNNTEEDVIFTNTCRKRKLWKRKQRKFSIPMDLVLGMQNLVLTETKEKQRLVEVGVSETEILQQQHLPALVSDMRNLVLTETKGKSNEDSNPSL